MALYPIYIYVRVDSTLAPSQWESSLQSNAASHWLGANLESALYVNEIALISMATHIYASIFELNRHCVYMESITSDAQCSTKAPAVTKLLPLRISFGTALTWCNISPIKVHSFIYTNYTSCLKKSIFMESSKQILKEAALRISSYSKIT